MPGRLVPTRIRVAQGDIVSISRHRLEPICFSLSYHKAWFKTLRGFNQQMCTCQINLQFRTHPTCVPCDLSSQRVQMSYGVTHRDIVCLPRQVLHVEQYKVPPCDTPLAKNRRAPLTKKPTHHYKFYAE